MTQPTSTTSAALHFGMGSKPGWSAGYWYIAFADDGNIKYASTDDPYCSAANFGSETIIKAGSDGSYFQAIFADPYCYMASVTPNSNPLKIRRGTCSGGSISWETEVTAASGTNMRVTSMEVMSDGSVLIGYYADNKAKVTRLTNSGGTWSTVSGYPMTVSDSDEDSVNMMVKAVDMGAGSWMVFYAGVTGGYVYSKVWSGSALSAKVQATDLLVSAVDRWDARADGAGKAVIAWNASSGPYYLRRRTYSGGAWGTAVSFETMSGDYYSKVPAVSVNKDTGDFFIAWQGYPSSTHVYSLKYTALTSTWGSVVDAATESSLGNTYYIVGIDRAVNDSVLFWYLTGSYTLDNIRIESLTASAGGVGPSGGIGIGGIMII